MANIQLTSNRKLRLIGSRPKVHGIGNGGAPGGTAATSLSIVDYAPDRIFQRRGQSRDITVSGSYQGAASSVDARAVPVGTPLSSTNFPWTNINAVFADGMYSGVLNVPQGGWYILQVRDAVNTAVAVTGVNKFEVGILVALIGQSNMVRLNGAVEYPLVNLRARRFVLSTGLWEYSGNYDITGTYPPNTPVSAYGSTFAYPNHGNGDGTVHFVNYLMEYSGVPVGTLEYAVSGSSMSDWQTNGPCYQQFASALAASGGECEAAVFLQGESDSGSTASPAVYKTGLQNLQSQLLASTGRTASNFNFGVVVVGPADGFSSAVGMIGRIRAAQIEFATGTPGAYLSGIATDADLAGDTIHFSNESQSIQGTRYAIGLAARLGALPYGAQGPRIANATRSGSVITVAIAQNGGTSIRDGAGGNGAGLTGFRVFEGANALTISSKSISGNNILLTLASVPTGVVTLDYAMTDAPFGNPMVPASAVYDNRVVPGDPRGLPLQPCAAITVTGG